MSLPDRYLAIDEEGYALFGETRVTEEATGAQILNGLKFAENNAFMTSVGGVDAFVEAFDEPLVIQMLDAPAEGFATWQAQAPYQTRFHFSLDSLTVDEWDRFHGVTSQGMPFVFTRKAQAAFFDLLEEFDDDSVTFGGKRHPIAPWMSSEAAVQTAKYWTDIYRNETPGWELNRPAPALAEMLPRMKLPKMRVLILGAGSGNDAAFFAEHGHVVTAVDFSEEAVKRGREKYGHLQNLKWVQSDAFKLPTDWTHSFDLIFEHTFYCAIAPEKRADLVAQWRRLLAPGGQLMGVFFTMERRIGPPFGGSEWELRERLKKHFQFDFWGRWHQSEDRRQGKELFVFAQKR
jgi:SAM-dependent methyltransferase